LVSQQLAHQLLQWHATSLLQPATRRWAESCKVAREDVSHLGAKSSGLRLWTAGHVSNRHRLSTLLALELATPCAAAVCFFSIWSMPMHRAGCNMHKGCLLLGRALLEHCSTQLDHAIAGQNVVTAEPLAHGQHAHALDCAAANVVDDGRSINYRCVTDLQVPLTLLEWQLAEAEWCASVNASCSADVGLVLFFFLKSSWLYHSQSDATSRS
jgi:hypothetical protein